MTEDQLQAKIYQHFHNHYPNLRGLLFAVPNGGWRNAREAQKLKSTGVVAGVADLLFIYKKRIYCFELKTAKGTQQKVQKQWQQVVENQGVDYFIIRSLDEFKKVLNNILQN